MDELEKSNVIVLIPAYNEEKNIGRVLGQLEGLGYKTVVSDDGSSDRTVEISRSFGAHVLTSQKNQGKGASLRLGFEWLRGQSYQAAVLMDADGQHDPKELILFLRALNPPNTMLVIGDRMTDPKAMPFIRVVTNRFMSWVISLLAGQKIPDSQCGYRVLKKELIDKIFLKTSRFEIESEMILETSRLGYQIASVKITSVYEGHTSHIQPLEDTGRFLKFILSAIFLKK